MPTRVLLDGTFTSTVNYYQTFPTEPFVDPDVDVDVLVPIDPADKIKPITLLALLTRMQAVPKDEKQLLIITHGNEKGLPFPLAPGSKQHAEDVNMNALTAVSKTLQQIPNILKLPLEKQPAEFSKLLKAAKNLDGSPMFLGAPLDKLLAPEDGDEPDTPAKKLDRQKKAVATYQAIVEWTLNAMAGKNDPVPSGVTTTATAVILDVNRTQLDDLLAKANAVRGKFDRIDFRGCNTGKNTTVLKVFRDFFGCKKLCAPDVVAFDGDMTISVDANFDKDLDRKIEAVTQAQAVAGHAPVKIDKATNSQVTIPISQMPMTRRFDTDTKRTGDEVFIRMWLTNVHPHKSEWWMRAISTANVEQFVKDKIDPDITKWKSRTTVPVAGLWLVDDFNTPPPVVIVVNPNAGPLDPVAPPPPPPPAFALPRDPEYRKHLICVS